MSSKNKIWRVLFRVFVCKHHKMDFGKTGNLLLQHAA